MKHIFTLAALVFATSCFGQAPTGEMENELLAWFPFSNNTFDASGNGNHAVLSGPESFSEGLYGEAICLSDANYMSMDNLLASGLTEFSCFAMVKLQQNLYADIAGDWGSSFLLRYVPSEGWALNVNGSDGSIQIMSGITPNWATWNRVGFVHDEEGLRLYVNGEVVASSAGNYFGTIYASSAIMTMGAQENQGTMNGWIDDVKMWSRGLSHDEVNALENNIPNSVGCMDSTACNFSPEVIFDDGSCHFNCFFCNEGTVWNEVTQGCDVANPSDTNFDGCVSMTDLLDLLSVFGTCAEDDSEEDFSEEEFGEWSCGDPLEYQGYGYATVLIGEQCWFAENLRCEEYGNGDPIPANLSDAEWTSTHSGAKSVYGEENATCQASYSPEGDACNDNWSLAEFGYLYNWYAATDPRGLCPSGWHLPSDNEWTLVTNHLGGDTVAGGHLKSTSGWNEEGLGGSNSSGFSGLPGGHRYYSNGNLNHAGNRGFWWSSSSVGSVAWLRRLDHDSGAVVRYNNSHRDGHSVRCIQDPE